MIQRGQAAERVVLARLRPWGLTILQFAVLRALRHAPPLHVRELARRVGRRRQSVGEALLGLLRNGWITDEVDIANRRLKGTRLTGPGATVLAGAEARLAALSLDRALALAQDDRREFGCDD